MDGMKTITDLGKQYGVTRQEVAAAIGALGVPCKQVGRYQFVSSDGMKILDPALKRLKRRKQKRTTQVP